MHPAIFPAVLAFSTSLALATYVGTRREKTDLNHSIVALCVGLMVWTGGTVCRFTVDTEEGLRAALVPILLGVFVVPPLWLMLAARFARLKVFSRFETVAALMIPPALSFLALLTNDAHRLVVREVSFAALEKGGLSWAGPIFWANVAYAYICIFFGVGIYLNIARRMSRTRDRKRVMALIAGAVLPALASSVYLFQWIPITFDLTPMALVATMVLMTTAIFRNQLVQVVPLAGRDVIEHLDDGVVMATASGVILDSNPRAAEILESTPGALRGRHMVDAFSRCASEPQRGEQSEKLAQLEEMATHRDPLVMELYTRDDRRIEVRVTCVFDAEGIAFGQFAVLRDRTEEHHGERVARQTQRFDAVGTLAAGIAHEVNNPLAFIRSNLSQIYRMGEYVEDAAENATGNEGKLVNELTDLRTIAEETLDGIARIEGIVSDMRELATQTEKERETVDLNTCVLDAIRLANLRQEMNIWVDTQLEENLPTVSGAPQRLVQAFLNLVVNARYVLENVKDATIRFETRSDKDNVYFLVTDNGVGISDEIQERIFDPFFTTKDPDQGSGLGLAIAFDILSDHGGNLEVRSRLGEGACFIARLPRSDR